MIGKRGGLLVATILVTLIWTANSSAQGILPPPGSAPVPIGPPPSIAPVAPPITDPAPGPGPIISRPVPIITQPVPVPPPSGLAPQQPLFPPPPPGPPPSTIGSPYGNPDRQELFFFTWDLQFTAPSVSNHLNNTVTLPGGATKTINIPGVALDFTVVPGFVLGYRLPERLGEFSVGYRFLITEGKSAQTANGVQTDFRSRLDFNEFDFDYATVHYEVEPHWFLQARIGGRVNWTYYDTRATVANLEDRESSYFAGAGPHIGLDLERRNLLMGFGFFAKVDGAVLIGQNDQHFGESVQNGFSASTQPLRKTLAVPTLQAQVGLSYTPPRMDWLRFRAGYQFERWFDFGNAAGSRLDLTTQGGFLQGEIDF